MPPKPLILSGNRLADFVPRWAYTFGMSWSVVAVLVFLLLSSQAGGSEDIVTKLMPKGNGSGAIQLRGITKASAVKQLSAAQRGAAGKRAQAIAFLLAALDVEYSKNRDFLTASLRQCQSTEHADCDEDTAELLIRLYKLGHSDVLQPLVAAGVHSDGAMSELLGVFYGSVLKNHAGQFVQAAKRLSPSEQESVCELAASGDGGGIDPKVGSQIRRSLHAIGGTVAVRCLREFDAADKREP